jgi:hypothetical protein
MYRLTARLLLTLLLVGIFAPVAMAISAPAPHACCLRKPQHSPHSSSVRAAKCGNHDCCRTATTANWAQGAPQHDTGLLLPSTSLRLDISPDFRITRFDIARPVRAPPAPAIA